MTTADEAIITSALLHRGIKTGDAVRVGTETWLVAFCEAGRVWCCGWPLSCVALDGPGDPIGIRRMATPEYAMRILRDMEHLQDPRGEYARRKLAEIRSSNEQNENRVD